jgi:hypothetical protein
MEEFLPREHLVAASGIRYLRDQLNGLPLLPDTGLLF